MSFEWATEEEHWDDPPAPPPEPPRRRRWRGVLLVLAVVGLLATAVWLVYRQAQNRIETAENVAREEVLTSHNLLLEASTAADTELLTNLLSGRDPNWTESQLNLLQQNQLFNRPLWGLETAVTQPTSPPTVTLNPELDEATLTTAVQYANPSGGAPLTYRHQLIYRRGSERWLLSPPERTATERIPNRYSGTHLLATFPVHDGHTARRLARDLNDSVATVCQAFDITCPPGRFLTLAFTEDPQTLLDMLAPAVTPARPFIRNTITLPTPALVGQPIDDEGYGQLFQGYANYVLGPLLEFGLEQVYGRDVNMRRIARQTYERQLVLTPAPQLTSLPRLAATQQVALLCHLPDGIYPHLYDPSTAVVTPTLHGRAFRAFYPAPDDASIALVEWFPGRYDEDQLLTWNPTAEQTSVLTSLPTATAYDFSWREHPLAPRLQLIYRNNGQVTGYERFRLDPEQGLRSEDAPGEAFWSDDGTRTLIRYSDGSLFLGDEAAVPQEAIGRGFNPFWIDTNTYGFLAPDQNIQMAVVGDDAPAQRITAAELESFRPPAADDSTFAIPFVIPVPDKPSLLLILGVDFALSGTPTAVHFFTYNRLSSQVTRLYTSDQIHSFFPDPQGERLALAEWNAEQEQYQLVLLNLSAEADPIIHPLPATAEPLSLDWSADGAWLAIMAGQQLSLWETATNQLTSGYPAGLSGCFDVAWVTTN